MTRVTVVIPALNDAPMVRRCLKALAQQTRPADEIIVVDNGSDDDLAQVAQLGGATLVPEPIRGTSPATARGFDSARGDLLARLDADSVPPPDWLAKVVARFEERPELAALTGPGDFYGSTPLIHYIAEHYYIGGYKWFVGMLLGHPPLFGSNMTLRRETWLRVRDSVHRTRREVHDDLDLSYAITPDMEVQWDEDLRVGVSARPFDSLSGLWRRISWAMGTFALNWESPLRRRAARRRIREQDARESTANA